MKLSKKFRCRTFKKEFFSKLRISIFYYLGGSWGIVEPLSFFISKMEDSLVAKIIIFVVALSGSIGLGVYRSIRSCSEMFSVYEKILGTDISVGLIVGNMFDLEGDFVISTNTEFKADERDPDSLQLQFIVN